jgi:3-oxoacyl-[acyl-carrier protein] reductase
VFDLTGKVALVTGAGQSVGAAEAELGPIDILVNNAGIPVGTEAKLFRDLDPAQWKPQIDLNTYGVMNCSKAVIDGMCERGYGRIVTVSSLAATEGVMGVSAYSAGKGGGIGFMHTLSLETARYGVTCNTVALGIMENMEGKGIAPTHPNPVGRYGTGRDVGAAIVWLAAEGSWVTGQTIGLNGGNPAS